MHKATRIAATVLAMALAQAQAQQLEKTQQVYKCERNGKVEYTEEPCLGAKTVDVTPTKGAETHPGANSKSLPLARERQREALITGTKPLTGMDVEQFNTFERRLPLTPRAKRTCAALDSLLPELERQEQQAKDKDAKDAASRKLFEARRLYRATKC